jgi:hypothetical protein
MSYWYERITKKHVIVMVFSIIPLLINGFAQIAGSYAGGCLATASRTLYDWISVERPFNEFEVYPYVPLYLDAGCIEWLGFSTCETVQFQNWMPIWMQGEVDSIHVFNMTETGTTKLLETPVIIDRIATDAGTSASLGELNLKRSMRISTWNLDDSQLGQIVGMSNPEYTASGVGQSANPWKHISLFELLSGVIYPGAYPAQVIHEKLVVPLPTRKGVRTLYYVLGTSNEDKKCVFDDDCGQQCAWSGTCEPQLYGHHGMVLPSGNFLFNWKNAFELGHWPLVAWKFGLYSTVKDYPNQGSGEPLPVTIFNSETFSRTIFDNTGSDGGSEKFPGVEIQVWKARLHIRRDICKDLHLGSQEKDCNIPADYVFIGQERYLSFPMSVDGAPMKSEIHSERVTGLRFDYLDVWQINRKISMSDSDMIPMYWIQRQPMTLKLDEKLQFSILKSYGGDTLTMVAVAWVAYIISYFIWLGMLFYGNSCVDFCKDSSNRYAPFQPSYI